MSKTNSGLFNGTTGSNYSNNLKFNFSNKHKKIPYNNKIEHILGDKNLSKHNLNAVLKEHNNDKIATYNSIKKSIQNHVSSNNIEDGKIKDKIKYNNHTITFSGIVQDGLYKPGTFYITMEDLKNEKKETNR